MDLVVIGLTLSSSWGNGHATTWRALLSAFAAQGGRVTFLERDVPWYAAHRDLPAPEFARLELYADLHELRARHSRRVRQADAVLIGSYVPDGVAVIDWALQTAGGSVSFYDIDTPVTLAKLARGDEEYLARRQIPLFERYFSFTGGPTLDRLRREHGARRPVPLYCTVDATRYRPEPGTPRRWRLGYLGTYSDDRQPALERLLIEPARRRTSDAFVVAGPQYPDRIRWPGNVNRIEHCPPAEHRRFYNSQDFTLNVTRADMVAAGWSPSVRLFEAASCAVPIISDRWPGLEALFPDGSVIIADHAAGVLAALDLSAAERRAIGEAAREIVLTGHRAEVRARELAGHLGAAGGRLGADGMTLGQSGRSFGRGARPSGRGARDAAARSEREGRSRGAAAMKATRTTLVTGGAGFIGSHLCERLLDEGDRVICLDSMLTGRHDNLAPFERNPRFDLIERDVTDPMPPRLRADRVFHLACAASPPHYQADPVHTMMTCVLGTRNCLELARACGARFLLSSTSEVYGDPETHPQPEDYRGAVSTTGPRACYDEGKRAAEALVCDYRRLHGLDVRIARLFNTYGPRMRPDDGRVVTNFIVQVLEGQPVTIYGDGSQTRSFCYIDDIVEALILLMESERAGAAPVNLGSPEEFTVRQLAELVIELSGRRVPLDRRPLPEDDPKRRRPSIERARRLLGWAPTTRLRDGLPPTIRHFEHDLVRAAALSRRDSAGSVTIAAAE